VTEPVVLPVMQDGCDASDAGLENINCGVLAQQSLAVFLHISSPP